MDVIVGNKKYNHNGNYEPGASKPVSAAFFGFIDPDGYYQTKETVRGIEDRFNKNFNYPYVFLSRDPISEEQKIQLRMMTKAPIEFGLVPKGLWDYPEWIDIKKAKEKMDKMVAEDVIFGGSEDFRFLSRFYSGFFFDHPLLEKIDYYWRIEPGASYSCQIEYDPFLYMHINDIKYGFTIAMFEIGKTIPSLWNTIKQFAQTNTNLISKNNSLEWVSLDGGKTYNMCHFWPNFEIANLNFFRSKEYRKFFDFVDKKGGFFYERWGEGPIHSIAASMFLSPSQIHWFDDIGYKKDPMINCPQDKDKYLKCSCNPLDSIIYNGYTVCTNDWSNKVKSIPPHHFANS
ncbi:Glycolipid 2-alpha-mannosyltransferase 2 [Smittium mucronatum]|uniref:Glycolipid 2-alpha-mannosyltransferase 2 n=1 Tax=Smittium mucronatum TaxID=133383 RepID=A0A1R0GVQ2_9FUNG|nr:Glycolipid 2-alpha-mannosyltransferase 2 [Smittium mucronatum]